MRDCFLFRQGGRVSGRKKRSLVEDGLVAGLAGKPRQKSRLSVGYLNALKFPLFHITEIIQH